MIRRHLVLTLALSGVAAMATPAVLHANDEGPPSAVRSQYGRAVAIAGDWAFIGEPGGSDQPGNPAAGGVVWVFNRGLPNAWQQSATLTLPGADVSAGFGAALAAEGDGLEHAVVEAALLLAEGAPAVLLVIAEDQPPALYQSWIGDVCFPYAVALLLKPGRSWQLRLEPAEGETTPSEWPHALELVRALLTSRSCWQHQWKRRRWNWQRNQ